MKRADITVGQRLYCDSSKDWAQGGYYVRSVLGRQVEVLDTAPVKTGWGDNRRMGVKVVWIREDGTRGREDVAHLAHLRGPYEPVAADVRATIEKRTARTEAAEQARQDTRARRDALVEELMGLSGITSVSDRNHNGTTITLNLDQLAAIVAALKAVGTEQPADSSDRVRVQPTTNQENRA